MDCSKCMQKQCYACVSYKQVAFTIDEGHCKLDGSFKFNTNSCSHHKCLFTILCERDFVDTVETENR